MRDMPKVAKRARPPEPPLDELRRRVKALSEQAGRLGNEDLALRAQLGRLYARVRLAAEHHAKAEKGDVLSEAVVADQLAQALQLARELEQAVRKRLAQGRAG